MKGSTGTRLTVLLAAGILFVAVRVLAAYWLQNSDNPEYAGAVLMAKHVADGIELPLSFYGQAHRGTMEPLLSALLCRLFGFSGFAVCMAAVLFSAATVPFLFLLGRKAGGYIAGITAVFFCVTGPVDFVLYTASPRGGYAAALFFSVFLLWALIEITCRESQGKSCGWWAYLFTGLAGGAACWVSFSVLPAIAAGLLINLAVLRAAAFKKPRVYMLIPGFMTGLAPLILWNAGNGWPGIRLILQDFQSYDFTSGGILFFERFAALFDLSGGAWYRTVIFCGFHLWFFVAAVKSLAEFFKTRSDLNRAIAVGGILFYAGIFAVCLGFFDFLCLETPGSLLPLVPATAVLAGVAVSRQTGRRRVAAVFLISVMILLQGLQFKVFETMKNEDDLALERSARLEQYLGEHEVRYMYGDLNTWHLNYYLNERYMVADALFERYQPYRRGVEAADSIGVLNPADQYGRFWKSIEVAYKEGRTEGFTVLHDFERTERPRKEVAPESIASVLDKSQKEVSHLVFDRTLLTGWSASAEKRTGHELVVSFNESLPIQGIRYICRKAQYPYTWMMLGRNSRNGEWIQLVDETAVTPFFWSGNRLFAGGPFFRVEGSFAPVMCSEIKLVFPDIPDGAGLRISELQLFQSASVDGKQSVDASIDDLARLIDKMRFETVYADKWETIQLKSRCGAKVFHEKGAIDVPVENGLAFRMEANVAIVVKTCDEGLTRRFLEGYGLQMSRQEVGPWSVFYFDPSEWRDEYRLITGIRWVGFGCFSESHKHRAVAVARLAEAEASKFRNYKTGISRMKGALAAYDNHRAGVGLLAAWLEEAGQKGEAVIWRDRYDTMWVPDMAASAYFSGRAELLGVSIDKTSVRPGGKLFMKYFWRAKPDKRVRELVVFTDFIIDEQRVFKDDRPFLADMDLLFQPFDEVFIEERAVNIPYGLESGDFEIWVGLRDVNYPFRRIPVRTRLTTRSRAVLIPAAIKINSEGN